MIQGAVVAEADTLSLTDQCSTYVEEAFSTSQIEGEVLDRERLRSSVAGRLGLPTAGLPKPDARSDALVEVLLDATRNYGAPLTAERICGWQAALFPTGHSGPFKIAVGRWRDRAAAMEIVSGPMGRERVHFVAPPADRVVDEMRRFLAWWNGESRTLDGIVRAGLAHLYFVTIHPFDDGNGRIARVLTDLALAEDERTSRRLYSLSSHIRSARGTYYSTLEATQRGDVDVTQWLLWFLDTLIASIGDAQGRIAHARFAEGIYRRMALLSLNPRQTKAISRMIDAYPAGFIGGMTNRKYASITHTTGETAKRDLGDLVRKGLLRKGDARGRSTYYVLAEEPAGRPGG